MLDREHRPGTTEASLDLVRDQRDLVLGAERAKRGQEIRWRHHETALTLHRLDEDARDPIGAHRRLEQLAHGLDAGPTQAFRRHAGGMPVLVRIRHLVDLGRVGAEILLVGRNLSRERHRHQGAAVKRVVETDHGRAARRLAHDLDRVLDRFRPAVQQEGLLGERSGRDLAEPAGEPNIRLGHHHRGA